MNTTAATRTYRQRERAAAAEATRDRIVAAAMALFREHWYDDVTLRAIAKDAGVALQTVVNHFQSKEGVFEAVVARFDREIRAARFAVEPGDVKGAIAALVDDYETNGEPTLRGQAIEHRVPAMRVALDHARGVHREWVERTFPAALTGLRGADRKRRLAQLATATDLLTWKVLRRDQGLSRDQTTTAIIELVEALHG